MDTLRNLKFAPDFETGESSGKGLIRPNVKFSSKYDKQAHCRWFDENQMGYSMTTIDSKEYIYRSLANNFVLRIRLQEYSCPHTFLFTHVQRYIFVVYGSLIVTDISNSFIVLYLVHKHRQKDDQIVVRTINLYRKVK